MKNILYPIGVIFCIVAFLAFLVVGVPYLMEEHPRPVVEKVCEMIEKGDYRVESGPSEWQERFAFSKEKYIDCRLETTPPYFLYIGNRQFETSISEYVMLREAVLEVKKKSISEEQRKAMENIENYKPVNQR